MDNEDRPRTRVLSDYRPETTLHHAKSIIDFDRRLHMIIMDGVERIEVAVRMQIGYVLGRTSAFAHEGHANFTEAFTQAGTDPDTGAPSPSSQARWLERVKERRAKSDKQLVAPFRDKYDNRMPVWAVTEILELGQLSALYRGLRQQDADEIALAFGVPAKKIMVSWLASLNYGGTWRPTTFGCSTRSFSTPRRGPRRDRCRSWTTSVMRSRPRASSVRTTLSR